MGEMINGVSLWSRIRTLLGGGLPAALAAGGGLKIEGVAGGVAQAVTDTWCAALTSSETSNDSDVTFTVTASQEWAIQSIRVELVTTATVGNRQITVMVTDGSDDILAEIKAGVTQAASLTYYYTFGVGLPDLTAVRATNYVLTPIVPWTLPAGYKIRVYDSAAVDAAADDMDLQMLYLYRAV